MIEKVLCEVRDSTEISFTCIHIAMAINAK
jgi:hypothetical protein